MNKLIRRSCREAKEEYWNEKCAEIERCQIKYDLINVHKFVKEVASTDCKQNVGDSMGSR